MSTTVAEQIKDQRKESDNDLVFSYLTLRNLIGVFGMLMPVILALSSYFSKNNRVVEQSISHYYYTPNGDVFVVLMSVLGVFLLTYKGYGWVERSITILAALCAMGVAFSPTECKDGHLTTIHTLRAEVPHLFGGPEVHLVFAATFFLGLAIMSLVYFPKTKKDEHTLRDDSGKRTPKAKRNIVFKICGWTIIGSLILLFLNFMYPLNTDLPVTFILETVAVEAFGLSWITKGETLWPDGEHYIVKGIREAKEKLKPGPEPPGNDEQKLKPVLENIS